VGKVAAEVFGPPLLRNGRVTSPRSFLCAAVFAQFFVPWVCSSASPLTEEIGTPPLSGHQARSGMRDPFYHRALIYLERYRRDDLGQAIRLLHQVIQIDPTFARAYGVLAEAHALRYLWGWDPDLQGLQKALDQGERGVRLDDKVAETHLGLGLAYLAADRYTPGVAELDRAVSLDADSLRSHVYRGMALRGLKRLEETREEVERALELAPSSPLAYSLLGDYYQERHDFTKAQDAYLTATQLDQSLLWPRLGLAAAYQKNLNFTSAGRTYDFTEADFPGDIPRCRIMAASLLVATQEYESAVRLYEGISQEENLSPPLLRRLMQAGRAYSLERIGKTEEAEFYWSQIIREFPPDFDGAVRDREVVSSAYEALVRYQEERGNPGRAKELLEQGCSRAGMSIALYSKLAERYREAGRLDQAVATFRRGLLGAPQGIDLVTTTQALLPLLRAVAKRKAADPVSQDAEGILQNLATRLGETGPDSYVPYLNLAKGEALLEHPLQALEHLRQAVEKGFSGLGRAGKDPDLKGLAKVPAFRVMVGGS